MSRTAVGLPFEGRQFYPQGWEMKEEFRFKSMRDRRREARTMIRINDLKCKATLRAAAVMSVFLLLAAVAGFGQVNLTVGPATTTLPDGNTVPMWGYSCGAVVTGSTAICSYLGNNYTS